MYTARSVVNARSSSTCSARVRPISANVNAVRPTNAASSPKTMPRVTWTAGFVAFSRTVPTTRSIVSAISAGQVGSVSGFPGIQRSVGVLTGLQPDTLDDDAGRRVHGGRRVVHDEDLDRPTVVGGVADAPASD